VGDGPTSITGALTASGVVGKRLRARRHRVGILNGSGIWVANHSGFVRNATQAAEGRALCVTKICAVNVENVSNVQQHVGCESALDQGDVTLTARSALGNAEEVS